MLHTPGSRQQLPQLIREPRRWPTRSVPFNNFKYNSRCGDAAERGTSSNNLPREPFNISIYSSGN